MTIPTLQGLGLPPGAPTIPTEPKARPVRKWRKRTDRPLVSSSKPSPDRLPFKFTTQLSTTPQPRRVSDKSTKSNRTGRSAESARSRRSAWSGKSFRSGSWKSNGSNRSIKSKRSSRFRARRLPPLDLHHPLSRLAEALDLANVGAPSAKERRATKAALALRQLILDPPQFEVCAVALPTAMTGLAAVGGADQVPVIQMAMTPDTPAAGNGNNTLTTVGTKGKKSFVPRLREKDVSRLRTQLLKPTEAKMVIAHARSLPVDALSNHDRAVCLNCPENEADGLIEAAHRVEDVRRQEEARASAHRFSTIKPSFKPAQEQPQPPRLPVLLSLYSGLTAAGVMPGAGIDPSINLLGLFEPASAMSLHRPLAGALPSAETLRRGFDALINAESKVYMYKGPSHKNIHPPTDRMSVYTYWWGFELALPPATMAYLAHAKSIATSVLNLLSVIVYAVPGGTRELAPFVGVLSRFIDNEWALLKSQDRGRGVVCGATWFIPAALVARPWDFGEESIRDRMIAEEERELLKKEKINPDAVLRIQGPEGEQEEGVVVGIGKAMVQPNPTVKKRGSPKLPWVGGRRGDGIGSASKDGTEAVGAGEKNAPPPLRTIPKPLPSPTNPATNGLTGIPDDEQNHDPIKAPNIDVPPAIRMPVFTTLLHQKAESAPASPIRTTPPTPARAKFGGMWRMRVNKGSEVSSERKRSARGKKAVWRKEDEMCLDQQGDALETQGEGDGSDVGGVSTAAPLEEVSIATPDSEAIELAAPLATRPAAGLIAAESTVAEDQVPLPDSLALDHVSRTLMSRTMRRVRGTMGRLRITGLGFSSSPTLQPDEKEKVEEKELGGPAGSVKNDSISHVDAIEHEPQATRRSKQFWASTRVQRRSSRGQIPWSTHETGAQTVREKSAVDLRRSLVVLEG